MSDLCWLTDGKLDRLRPFFPKSHGKPRVEDRCVLSGIVFVDLNGLRPRNESKDYGPHKTLYHRWEVVGRGRPVGRIERALFHARLVRRSEQRRRTGSIVNKGEARNALARAIVTSA